MANKRLQQLDERTQSIIKSLSGKTDDFSKRQVQQAMALRNANGLSPSDTELSLWGINRDQYKSMYSQASEDWKNNTDGIAKFFAGNPTNEINQYLYSKMIKSPQYSDKAVTIDPVTIQANAEPVNRSASDYAANLSSGGGGVPVNDSTPDSTNYTEEDLAKKFGIVNDYATILKEMQDATESKFKEIDATLNRAQSSNARSQETAYSQYLQDLRSRAANAVASGATKGTMAANALGSLMSSQEMNREGVNTLNTLIADSALQKGTALKTDATLARQTANELGQYLGNLATSRDTNNINKYVGELSANAQKYAASVQAGATTNAARIASNAAADKILEIYKNTYKAKGLSDKDAFNAANIRYADYLDRTIAK